MKATIEVAGTTHDVEVLGDGRIRVDGELVKPGPAAVNGSTARLGSRILAFRVVHVARSGGPAHTGPAQVRAPMHGKIVSLATPGDSIQAGQPLFVLEAMKMQNEVKAPRDGVVRRVLAKAGDVVESGRPIIELDEPK